MRRDGLDGREVVTWRFETGEATGDGDWLAHNPEVAGSNPVPATSIGAGQRWFFDQTATDLRWVCDAGQLI